jgi:hydroxymethylpyrimidine/phosphomethylpyrimidine kinase
VTSQIEDRAVALTIAGSDSGGGAGIQADLKTFHAFGVFGTSAITAITAQNTLEVRSVGPVEPALITAQIEAVVDDLAPAACKTGMLAESAVIEAVAAALESASIQHTVSDPVMVSASGARLLDAAAVGTLKERLLPLADLVTPNLDEASVLAGFPVHDLDTMRRAGESILGLGCRAVLIKGGHLDSAEVQDLLMTAARERIWRAPKHPVGNAHGTGCTLSAAITAGLALGRSMEDAVDDGLAYTRRAIQTAPPLGKGSRPLNHWARD